MTHHFLQFYFFCFCIYTGICLCVHRHVYVNTCTILAGTCGGQRLTLGIFSEWYPFCLERQGLLLNLKFSNASGVDKCCYRDPLSIHLNIVGKISHLPSFYCVHTVRSSNPLTGTKNDFFLCPFFFLCLFQIV